MALLFIGLVTFLLGIYLSIHWEVIGIFLGVGGGIILGSSTYFLAMKRTD